MRNPNIAIIVVILSIVVHAKCVGDSDEGFKQNRFDPTLQSCLDNFDVHTDMIIRTQDSRAMGAKYLNEAEVSSRDECQKLCCETDSCDVYIHEQKIPGSCYLFHCGSPEDFKCKFTQHRNYTSAILTLNNHLNELENQIKLTKHEEELNSLRKSEPLPVTAGPTVPTSTKVPDPVEGKANHSSSSHCSRYQFECRGSRECIAIYNACDGISQCADGSDEAPELDCPTLTAGTPRPKSSDTSKKEVTKIDSSSKASQQVTQEINPQMKNTTPYKPPATWQQNPSGGYVLGYGMSQPSEKMSEFPQKLDQQQQQQLAYQARFYGREGEVLAQQYPLNNLQWQAYPMQRQDDGSHIFNHKGTGLVPESSDRYSNRKDLYNRIDHGQIPGPYGPEIGRSDYLKYSPANGMTGSAYYNGPMYYPNNAPQRQQHALDEIQQRPGPGMYVNSLSAPGASDYYYEDPQMRARMPVLQDPHITKNSENLPIQSQVPVKNLDSQIALKTSLLEEKPKITESVKKTLEEEHKPTTLKSAYVKDNVEMTTVPVKFVDGSSHGVAAELRMSETESDTENNRPSGAILSLTLGMCLTAIMIALVGCRLRVVRRRMRRGGKSPYGDFRDPDFLVNGMYL